MQTKLYETLVDKHREEILAAEDYIWRHPETGFREWKTTAYMQDVFEKAGYTLVKAGDIPGFYTDIETGRPGPKLLIMAELDALSAPNHVQAVDGCAHACGHHAQCAAMAGIALALKEPGALDGLSGSVRLMCVPAEELIELDFRDGLRREGVIHYLGGKTDGLFENKPNGKTHVDLRGANARRLEQLGLKRENIDVSEECTMCLPEKYWSHRATDGVRGSMAATIML